MKVKSENEVAQVVYLKVTQSCPTPSNPMDRSPPGSSVHGIFQARVLEWGAIAFSNYLLQLLFITRAKNCCAPTVSQEVDFKTKAVKRDKEDHYIMIKGSIQEDDITIINIYAPNIRAPQYVR